MIEDIKKSAKKYKGDFNKFLEFKPRLESVLGDMAFNNFEITEPELYRIG